jgi:hypothetical protein
MQIIRFYLSLVRSVAYGESEVNLFACKEIINRNWARGKLPSVSLNSSTELAVVAADGRLFQSRMDLGKRSFGRHPSWFKNYTDRQPGSVTQMVTQLGWEPLQVRRVKIRLLLLFKTQHNLVAIPAFTENKK